MVVEPAGLLPTKQGHLEAGAVFLYLYHLWRIPEGRCHIAVQAFQFTAATVVAPQYGTGFEHLVQGGDDLVLHRFHTGRADLGNQHIVKTVHHQARQLIAFTVDQTIKGLVVKTLAQGKGNIDAVYQ